MTHGEPCTEADPWWTRTLWLRCTDPTCEGRDRHRPGTPVYHLRDSTFDVNDSARRAGHSPTPSYRNEV